MKTKSKALLLALCAVLLVAASVLGTLAYLTSQAEVKNTFTVGKVAINLDEMDVTKTDGSRTEEGNKYHLLPGQTYVKDPTVTILEGSEESYVRMIVKVSNYSNLKAAFPADKYPTWYNGEDFLLQYLVTGWDAGKWVSTNLVTVTDDVATYEFRYYQTVKGPAENKDDKTDGTKLEALFTNIVVPGTVNNNELPNLQNVTITVQAHAIQIAGFNTANDAWVAFDKQNS